MSALAALRSAPVEGFFLAVSWVGSSPVYLVLAFLYFWLIDPRAGRKLGVLLGFSAMASVALKSWVGRPRPFAAHPETLSAAARATAGGPSFPSGHAQGAATFWGFLALRHRRPWLIALAAGAIALVAVARVELGVHYPGDVAAGIGLGLLLAWAASVLSLPELPGRLSRLAAFAAGLLLALLGVHPAPAATVAGFLAVRPRGAPPATWRGRALLACGLLPVGGLHLLLRWVAGRAIDLPAVAYLELLAVVLFALEVWPLLAARAGGLASGRRPVDTSGGAY